MAARSRAHNAPSPGEGESEGGEADTWQGAEPGEDGLLLAALLDGMDAALCAFDAEGVVTHWNREAERILGWTRQEAVGRKGLAGWAVRTADAPEVEQRLLAAMGSPGRRVHEYALLRKDGGRVLVRIQSCGVRGEDGTPTGVYCAFSEVHTQIDLERSLALSESLLEEAPWGVVLVDADLRPTALNARAVADFGLASPASLLGRPLGDVLEQGVEELEGALRLVLAEGPPPAPGEIRVTLRDPRDARQREESEPLRSRQRCWQSGFLLLSSPLAEEPSPLGAAWFFRDVTEEKQQAQESARFRFREKQTHRAARVAAECVDPMEAATTHLEFALAGFADHAVLDLLAPGSPLVDRPEGEPSPALLRAVLTPPLPAGEDAHAATGAEGGLPVGYGAAHPALQALRRTGAVRASLPGPEPRAEWAAERRWPEGTMHGLCVVLRAGGRSLGVASFLRGAGRTPFDRVDAEYAEDVAFRVASAVASGRSAG
ncbi:PAS domain-containing protein [Streptomyces xiaopingdaonensis]|uniref:PAS domain-containing protein n=1 Tax=Streptomyces xiaopingdaonensis TaxID=1565415 RepID=UPI0002EE81E7|nr:PAS domain-containing protein [Streptomyces xiaopingdaonensis]